MDDVIEGRTRVAQVHAGASGDGLGVATGRPRLRWTLALDEAPDEAPDEPPAVRPEASDPTGYEIRVRWEDGEMQSTGWVDSAAQAAPWPFRALRSRERARVEVRVRRGRDETGWSAPLPIEASLLDASEWRGAKIGPARHVEEGRESAVFRLRRDVSASGIRRARLYATAHGLIVPYVNGRRVSDELLAPGWTSYDHRLRFRAHDVTDLLVDGRNAIGFELAEGWYRGRFGFDHGARGIYGIRIGVMAQLEIEHDDGRLEIVPTDETWRCSSGPTTFTNLYDGEECDLGLDEPGWCLPETDVGDWPTAAVAPFDPAVLEPADSPPVRRTELREPAAVETVREGVLRYDFGQNLVGRLRLRVDGPAGATATLRHAEVLEGGELGVRPLRLARATDRLTLAGGAVEWEPEFVTHGFRYAEVALSDPRARVLEASAVVVHSDMARTGWLETSDPMLDRLYDNAVWSLRGNFVDLPTDCPQRDERLGWTGDINVFAGTATLLYDVSAVLRSWLRDLSAEQLAHVRRIPPMFVPSIITEPHLAGVWGDATVGVPWALYERDGDVSQLEESYPSVRAWIELVESRLGPSGVWDTDVQLGDWLDPTAPPDAPRAGRTDPNLVATAYAVRSIRLAARIATLLGETEDATRFAALAEATAAAFRREYVSPSGRIASDSQAAYALAIVFDLYDEPAPLARGGERLRELVRDGGHRVGTGFVGTALILDALTKTGSVDDAWSMLTQTAFPSFLYPVTMGATTVWERWDSMLPDGRINPGEMTSFNHYALGAAVGWMQRTVGGIESLEPGGGVVRIRPRPGGGVTWARARQILPRGEVRTSWSVGEGDFRLEASVPPGVRARVVLPDGHEEDVAAGTHTWRCRMPVVEAAPEERSRERGRMVIRTAYP